MGGQVVYLYIISSPTGHVKVGVAKNPQKRLRQLQGANPLPLVIERAVGFRALGMAEQVEWRTHKLLKDQHAMGEWFLCSLSEAATAVAAATKYVRNRRGDLTYYGYAKFSKTMGNGVEGLR